MEFEISYRVFSGSVHVYFMQLLSVYIEAKHQRELLKYLEEQNLLARWWRLGIELQLPNNDLMMIQDNEDRLESQAAAMLNKWLTSGKANKQALVEAVRAIK